MLRSVPGNHFLVPTNKRTFQTKNIFEVDKLFFKFSIIFLGLPGIHFLHIKSFPEVTQSIKAKSSMVSKIICINRCCEYYETINIHSIASRHLYLPAESEPICISKHCNIYAIYVVLYYKDSGLCVAVSKGVVGILYLLHCLSLTIFVYIVLWNIYF